MRWWITFLVAIAVPIAALAVFVMAPMLFVGLLAFGLLAGFAWDFADGD